MEELLKQKIDNYFENYRLFKSKFRFSSNNLLLRLAAGIFSLYDKQPDTVEIKAFFKYMKYNTGVFSSFRSILRLPAAAMLISKESNPREAFKKLIKCREELRKSGFRAGLYLGIAALSMIDSSMDHDELAQKASVIYKIMKREHYWLTSGDDYIMSVLLGAQEQEPEIIMERVETAFFKLMEAGFKRSGGLQMLSHILALGSEDMNTLVIRCRRIYDLLKENGVRLNLMYLSSLGVLTHCSTDEYGAVNSILEGLAYLKTQGKSRGYHKKLNVILLSAMAGSVSLKQRIKQQNLAAAFMGISVYALVAAQTAVVMAATSAVAAASSS